MVIAQTGGQGHGVGYGPHILGKAGHGAHAVFVLAEQGATGPIIVILGGFQIVVIGADGDRVSAQGCCGPQFGRHFRVIHIAFLAWIVIGAASVIQVQVVVAAIAQIGVEAQPFSDLLVV